MAKFRLAGTQQAAVSATQSSKLILHVPRNRWPRRWLQKSHQTQETSSKYVGLQNGKARPSKKNSASSLLSRERFLDGDIYCGRSLVELPFLAGEAIVAAPLAVTAFFTGIRQLFLQDRGLCAR